MNEYRIIKVESFRCLDREARHGTIHVRPLPGQSPFKTTMFVECPNSLKKDYPVGTVFRIKAKIISREGGTPFVYTHYSWPFDVLEDE